MYMLKWDIFFSIKIHRKTGCKGNHWTFTPGAVSIGLSRINRCSEPWENGLGNPFDICGSVLKIISKIMNKMETYLSGQQGRVNCSYFY